MRYVSLFSGIEAATVAWKPLGWEAVAFAEVEPFCCDLLAARYPDVPNLGDVSKIDWSEIGAVDVVVGGSPCQPYSVAGKRQGLMDSRGRLMLEYVRAVHDIRPRWLLWENVPGVLSQSGGDAFETLLDELEQCGYTLAWRILDAQFFGVAQRRRRVFVVGNLGDRGGRAAAVLFEPESLRWDSASSRDKRKSLAADSGKSPAYTCVTRCGCEGGGKGALVSEDVSLALSTLNEQTVFQPTYSISTANTSQNGRHWAEEVAPTLDCAGPCAVTQYGDVAGTLTARSDSSPCADRGQTVIAFQPKASASRGLSVGEISPTLVTTKTPAVVTSSGDDMVGALCARDYKGIGNQDIGEGKVLIDGMTVRRLTPTECERLQGFPDQYTQLGDTKDTPRYKALGNSMAVPVMRWIGERIQEVDRCVSSA